MRLQGKRIALFLEQMYEDLEFWYPYYRMREEGAEVVVLAPDKEVYRGKHGVPAKADRAIKGARADEFDALIIPGGYSPDHMRRHRDMVDFVTHMAKANRVVAAICHGPWMLASAEVIRGKRVTSFFSIKDDLIHAGAQWEDKEVVTDGNIITSRNPDDLPAFCRSIIGMLS